MRKIARDLCSIILVQNKVMDLIQKKDLRDDHGELFGFGTHMFRHVYGIRLTELHLDDWTIAKTIGAYICKECEILPEDEPPDHRR